MLRFLISGMILFVLNFVYCLHFIYTSLCMNYDKSIILYLYKIFRGSSLEISSFIFGFFWLFFLSEDSVTCLL